MGELFDGDDMADAIEELSTGIYAVTRRAAATVDGNGRKVAPATSTFEAVGVLYPLEGRELERLPEGLREREARVFITTSELRTVAQGEPDVLDDAEGGLFEVQKSAPWRGGRFWRCVVVRKP